MTDNLLAVVREHVAGMTWRELVIVRDVLESELNATITREQAEDVT